MAAWHQSHAVQQMSLRRKKLLCSSERISSDLERLHKDKEEHEAHIDMALEEIQEHQQRVQQLLHPEAGVSDETKLKKNRFTAAPFDVTQWETSDVIDWLEAKGLHKFSPLFLKENIVGKELINMKLPFLESLPVEEKELILSEVYELLKLQTSDDEDATRLQTPDEKRKYQLAWQLSKDKESTSPLVLTSPAISSLPTPKLRKKTDSDQHSKKYANVVNVGTYCTLPRNKTKISTPRRRLDVIKKAARKAPVSPQNSLFSAMEGQSSMEVTSLWLQKINGTFGIKFQRDLRSGLLIQELSQTLQDSPVMVGDRVLEVNCLNVIQCSEQAYEQVQSMLKSKDELRLVVTSQLSTPRMCNMNRKMVLRDSEDLLDDQWQQFRNFLEVEGERDIDVNEIISGVPQAELSSLKEKVKLQDEIHQLQEKLKAQEEDIRKLQQEVVNREQELEEVRKQREIALNITRNTLRERNKQGLDDDGVSEYYRVTIDALNVENASKEELVGCLKDIVREASRQKIYLDRLISIVIDESPWFLESIDSDFERVTNNGAEVFC